MEKAMPSLPRPLLPALLACAALGGAACLPMAGPPAWLAPPPAPAYWLLASLALAPLPLLRSRRRRRHRAGLLSLGLQLAPDALTLRRRATLRLARVTPARWAASQDGWRLELERGGAPDLSWRLSLHTAARAGAPSQARAASLESVLEAARRLWGPAVDRTAPADWLEHDLEIALPDQRRRLTILAEGGYALQDAAGCTAISPVLAERLLAASQAVPSRATPNLTA